MEPAARQNTSGLKLQSGRPSNPYLHDNSNYADQLVANVTSSTAIELGKNKPAIRKALTATNSRQKN